MARYACFNKIHLRILFFDSEDEDVICPDCNSSQYIELLDKPVNISRPRPSDTKYYSPYGNNIMGAITSTTTTRCKTCNREFIYNYLGGPKRELCPDCGGLTNSFIRFK
jgi:Zn finger protein HypA/HybF involved in hydrogenase expression